jgi:mono/diheme cytochrome c family protein
MTARSRAAGARVLAAAALASLVATACTSYGTSYAPAYGPPPPPPPPAYASPAYAPPPIAGAPAPATTADDFAAQAARGQAAYARSCAACHGAAGEGSKAPALVGPSALPLTRANAKLRTGAFRTAGDVARFAVATMPPVGAKPTADEYWAILAFALKANGVQRTEPVGPGNADSIVLHP